jgi:hypothetical protein
MINLINGLFSSPFSQKRKNADQGMAKLFRSQDHHLAAVKIGDYYVHARIKDDLALLESVPNPSTGYHYRDIVEVRGPIGTIPFRDKEISIYELVQLLESSGIPTFLFKAKIPTTDGYFSLVSSFGKEESISFPYSSKDNNKEWRKGYCAVQSYERLMEILSYFIFTDHDCKFKDISEYQAWSEGKRSDFLHTGTLEYQNLDKVFVFKYSKAWKYVLIFVAGIMPNIMFFMIYLKGRTHSAADNAGFIATFIFFSLLAVYLFLRASKEKVYVDSLGIRIEYPISCDKKLLWNEISEAKTPKLDFDYIILKSKNKAKMRLSCWLRNYDKLRGILKAHLPSHVIKNKL